MSDDSRMLDELRGGWLVQDAHTKPIIAGKGSEVDNILVAMKLEASLLAARGETNSLIFTMEASLALYLASQLLQSALDALDKAADLQDE